MMCLLYLQPHAKLTEAFAAVALFHMATSLAAALLLPTVDVHVA